jgi:hypothetical protein
MSLWFAGTAARWLITPASHPGASTLRYVGVWLQLIIATVLLILFYRKARAVANSSAVSAS